MKKYLLPISACLAVIAALLVFLLVPNGKNDKAVTVTETITNSPYPEKTDDGMIRIPAEKLSHDNISFIRIAENSRIEILARIGDDGLPKAALGTCQSCNGSPKAYYTQEGDQLKCNNCGLTFPINVIDSQGYGCHPISIDSSIVRISDQEILLDAEKLAAYEPLFEKIEAH